MGVAPISTTGLGVVYIFSLIYYIGEISRYNPSTKNERETKMSNNILDELEFKSKVLTFKLVQAFKTTDYKDLAKSFTVIIRDYCSLVGRENGRVPCMISLQNIDILDMRIDTTRNKEYSEYLSMFWENSANAFMIYGHDKDDNELLAIQVGLDNDLKFHIIDMLKK